MSWISFCLVIECFVISFIVVDGKFLTTDQLEVNGTGPTAHVPIMFGWMRDDGADFVGALPTVNTTLTTALLGAGYVSESQMLLQRLMSH